MKANRALDYLMAEPWAIRPEALTVIAEIAARENEYAGDLVALEAKLGRPLGNTMETTVRDGIAIIPMEGPMFKRANMFQAISGATDYANIALDITTADEDPAVEAILVRADTPGGEVSGISDCAEIIRNCSKPVWVHIDGECCSAGFWLATAAQRVTASPSALVGSVGVQLGMTIKDPVPGAKSYRFIGSQSPLKNAAPDTEAGSERYQALADDLGSVFYAAVADNLGVTLEHALENFGRGDVMVAAKALESGMIHGVSTFEKTFSDLKRELKSMNYADLTVAALAENRADLVAAIRTEALAGVTTVDAKVEREAGAVAERARIVAIEALAVPGGEAVINAAKADGSTAESTAMALVKHMQTAQANSGALALAAIKKAETDMVPPSASTGDETATAKSAELTKGAADMEALRKAGII